MKEESLLFLDAGSGIAGDMLVAALLDLGSPFALVEDAVLGLALPGVQLATERVSRGAIEATKFAVSHCERHHHRSFRDIRSLLDQAAHLDEATRSLASRVFARLAEAEGRVHGVPAEEVTFHEVGAADSIADIVGSAALLTHIGARVVVSPLPLGHGVTDSAHGPIPLPAPATVLCLEGVPTYSGEVEMELVTPTGAALVAEVAGGFSRWPTMRPRRTGFGAGSRARADRPNVLRAVLGDAPRQSDSTFVTVETNIDDCTAEVVAHVLARLLAEGALDAWTVPIGMKKGRPAVMLSALVRTPDAQRIVDLVLGETTSLGVRLRPCERVERPRRIVRVKTLYGEVPVKIAAGDGLAPTLAPELEACRALAEGHGVTLKEVVAAALHAAQGPMT